MISARHSPQHSCTSKLRILHYARYIVGHAPGRRQAAARSTLLIRTNGSTMDTHYSPDLSVGTLFSRAWQVFRANVGFMIGVFLIYALLTGSASIIDTDGFFDNLGDLIMFVISGPVTAGAYAVSLSLMRGEQADLGEMFDGFREFGRAFGVFALYSIAIVVGLVLLIVPGIYIAVALTPAMYLVLDDRLGVVDTLRKAWAMTEGYRWQIFVVGLAVIGINILGLIALVIGIIFTGALSLLVGAALYDELDRAYRSETVEISH